MKKIIILTSVAFLLFFQACKKTDGTNNNNQPDDSTLIKSVNHEINAIANAFFMNRIEFPPGISVLPVENVTLEGLPYKKVQLFHLYFTHYLFGII